MHCVVSILLFLSSLSVWAADNSASADLSRYMQHEFLVDALRVHTNVAWHLEQNHLLVISDFTSGGQLRYCVTKGGDDRDIRYTGLAFQAGGEKQLSEASLASLGSALQRLPSENLYPPIDRLVVVTFSEGTNWITRSYDGDALPTAVRQIYSVIGERWESRCARYEKIFRQQLADCKPVKEWGYVVTNLHIWQPHDFLPSVVEVVFGVPGEASPRRQVTLRSDGQGGFCGRIYRDPRDAYSDSNPSTKGRTNAAMANLEVRLPGSEFTALDTNRIGQEQAILLATHLKLNMLEQEAKAFLRSNGLGFSFFTGSGERFGWRDWFPLTNGGAFVLECMPDGAGKHGLLKGASIRSNDLTVFSFSLTHAP